MIEDNDVGSTQYWRDIKQARQANRADNRELSAGVLYDAGIQYTTNNGGVHLIVEGATGFIDFWPGTGRWKDRAGSKGFGVHNLVKHIKGT